MMGQTGGVGADGGGAEGDETAEGDGIRTFPFPAELAVGGVGMQIGPMGTDRTWHAEAPCTASTASTSTWSCSSPAAPYGT